MFLVGTDQMEAGNTSQNMTKNQNKLAYVMAGGDLSEATCL
jgi:3-hydroxyacyl-CoA dehydrogenase